MHLATCHQLTLRLSLERLGHVHYPFHHLSPSDTWAITAKVGACALFIKPLVSNSKLSLLLKNFGHVCYLLCHS